MTERLPDQWIPRDYPVLMEVARRVDGDDGFASLSAVAETLGMSEASVRNAADALRRRGLIVTSDDVSGPYAVTDLAGAAYLVTGMHPDPDDALSSLVQLLREAADQQPDEDERGRLRRAADGLTGVSRGVMTGVLTAYLTGQIPGH